MRAGLGLAEVRVEPEVGERFDQTLASLDLALERQPSRRPWQLWESLRLRLDAGSSDGDSWRRFGGEVGLGLSYRANGVAVSWQRHWVRGDPSRFDLLQVGGASGSLVPAGVRGAQVEVPALPAAILVGDEHEGQRGSLLLGGLPLFFERHRVWSRGGPKGVWLRLAGLEVDLANDPDAAGQDPGAAVACRCGARPRPAARGREPVLAAAGVSPLTAVGGPDRPAAQPSVRPPARGAYWSDREVRDAVPEP
ncbi:MAG: hypothetical protein AB2L07_08215 [Thermoanaerobaculaceae bacterium]